MSTYVVHRALTLATGLLSALPAFADPTQTPESRSFGFADPTLQWNSCPSFMPTGCALAVLHGDPSKPNVDVFFKVPGGARIPAHRHTSAERMVLVSGALEVTYAGEPAKKLTAGMYAYGPPNKPHSANCAEGAPCVLFIAFEEPLDAMPHDTAGR